METATATDTVTSMERDEPRSAGLLDATTTAVMDRSVAIAPVTSTATGKAASKSGASARPSLDELRERIARIVAKEAPPAPRADPARGELPFAMEHTEHGPLYVRRARSVPAAKVGRVPLVAARDADPAMLALLALDPVLGECDPRRALYVDTETTGLAGGTGTVPFLLGLAWLDPASGAFVVEQALLRRLGEEAPILALFAERVAEASMIVTFNGKAFDLPLLRTRYVMNRMKAPAEPPHLDLVHMARRIHKTRLKTRTLVAIEAEILGRLRVGDVAGGDIVATYAHFLRTGDEEALLGVVEHNAADVLSMVALLGLYGEPLGRPAEEGEEGDPYAPAVLDGADLAGVARTLRQAGALDRAAALAEAAVQRGGGALAVRARGDIAKARGDKARALADYEALAAEVDDPAVRLSLAKLYEHHVRSFEQALAILERGTGEDEEAAARRKERLERKRARSVRTALLPGIGIEDTSTSAKRKRTRSK
ncbi:Hypothetical protein A7982_02575 [Minicystis rosea]|nr:Hypothetical protein A7982_02575 [Minicystis rosea]